MYWILEFEGDCNYIGLVTLHRTYSAQTNSSRHTVYLKNVIVAAVTAEESSLDSITLIQVAMELLLLLIYDNSLRVHTRAGLLAGHTVQFVEQDSRLCELMRAVYISGSAMQMWEGYRNENKNPSGPTAKACV